MARSKASQTAIAGFGFIYQPTYVDRSGEKKKSGVWWLSYEARDGKEIRRSTKTRSQELAYAELLRMAGRKGSGELLDASPERVTFDVLFDLLEDDYRRQQQATLT